MLERLPVSLIGIWVCLLLMYIGHNQVFSKMIDRKIQKLDKKLAKIQNEYEV